jgi:hypothetical protein
MERSGLWKLAMIQSKNIQNIKNAKAKNRQIVLLCKTLTKAMKGGA